jgi:hypothetical protein
MNGGLRIKNPLSYKTIWQKFGIGVEVKGISGIAYNKNVWS